MKSIRFALLWSSLAVAIVGLCGSAFAHSVTSPANVRSGPSPKWPVVAVIPAGGEVDVLNCGQGWRRAWCEVKYGDVRGFVNAGTLAPSGRNDVIVAPVVTNDLANLRKGPGSNWSVLTVIPASTPVNVHYCSNTWHGDWCKVSFAGLTGFVHGALLERQGALF